MTWWEEYSTSHHEEFRRKKNAIHVVRSTLPFKGLGTVIFLVTLNSKVPLVNIRLVNALTYVNQQ